MLQREDSVTKTPEGLSGGEEQQTGQCGSTEGATPAFLRDLGAYSAHFQIGVTNTKALLSHLIHERF